jgi:formylmethanofuran dehydrogenase subunit E
MAQIKEAGHKLLSVQKVQVEAEKVRRKKMGPVGICSVCGEAYPSKDGEKCRNCQGETPYTKATKIKSTK